MTSRYTPEDVVRWRQADEGRIPMKISQLTDEAFNGRRDFVISGLHLLHQGLGYTHIALGEPSVARSHFVESCTYVLRLFNLPHQGQIVSPERLRAGYCQSWLIALAIGEDALASSLSDSFRDHYLTGEESLAQIELVAIALKFLIEGRLGSAKEILQARAAPVESGFGHQIDCLVAIANLEEDKFRESLELAAKDWLVRIVKTHKGLPESVCYMQGLGLLRLAERFAGRPIGIGSDVIPSQLFSIPGVWDMHDGVCAKP